MKNVLVFLVGLLIVNSTVHAQNETLFKHKVGDYEVFLLNETQRKADKSILIGATTEMLEKYTDAGTFPNAVNAFLVKTPEKNILVDAGFGTKLFSNLQSIGITEEQIDIVLITHMHGDHIGGMLRDGKISFPRAEIYIPQPEYDYWMSDAAMNSVPENKRGGFNGARKVIEAYKNKLHLFEPAELEEDTQNLFAGFQGLAAYGHTPGHTMYLLESGDDKFLIWGDLTHAMAVQMPYPQVAVTYDLDPETAIASRTFVLEYVVENEIPVAGMHVAYPAMGKIISNNEGYTFTPLQEEQKH